ncbi:hypothetical protein SprV_0602063900 [Sparganum proliferum]
MARAVWFSSSAPKPQMATCGSVVRLLGIVHLYTVDTTDNLENNDEPYEVHILKDLGISLDSPDTAIDLQKFVHQLQCSHLPAKKMNSLLCSFTGDLISQFGSENENDAPIEGYFSKGTFNSFPNVDCAWHQLFIQLLLTVPGNDLIGILQKLLVSRESSSNLRWSILLPLVSCLAVCVKGGVNLLKDLLLQVLVAVFANEQTSTAAAAGDLLEDDSLSDGDEENADGKAWFSGIAGASADSPRAENDCRLKAALLIARQLFSGDSRIVGCTYRQWWAEHFAATPSSIPNGGSGVLSSRRSVAYLARELTSLLPYEMNPIFLRTQISVTPFWVSGQRAASRGDPDASTGLVVEPGEQWLETWLDYVDIARGRLAELRCVEHSPSAPATSILEQPTASTKHWAEVHTHLQEYSAQAAATTSSSLDKLNARLPASLVEMSLFRLRFFQETFLPLLQRPPPCISLPAPLDDARVRLLRAIDQHLCVQRPETGRLAGSTKQPITGRRVRKRKKT